jgi:hypothetical protein
MLTQSRGRVVGMPVTGSNTKDPISATASTTDHAKCWRPAVGALFA